MRLLIRGVMIVLVAALLAVAVIAYYIAYPNLPAYSPARDLHYLQDWSDADRDTYYFTPQGTQVKGLHYDWFVNLEQPFSTQRFAAPENLGRFGFLIEPGHAQNPHDLPIGFTRHPSENGDTQFLDISCAACHTGELRFNGTALRVDGGTAQHVLPATVPTLRGGDFGQALAASMAATYYNPWKFKRFALAVLGEQGYEAGHDALRAALKASLNSILHTAWNDTHRGLYPVQEGPGRADAFGRIANATFGDAISADNYRVANAPVDYPHLWDIWTFDWVQWNGSAQQPMARNIGEALGVGATLEFFDAHGQPLMGDERYPSSVRVMDLYRIEQAVERLPAPQWPEAVLGQADLTRAAQGRQLFQENCAACHVPPVDHSGPRPVAKLQMRSVDYMGTDPTAANNIADHRFDVSALNWDVQALKTMNVQLEDPSEPLDLKHISVAKALAYVTAFVEARAYRQAGIGPQEQTRLNGFGMDIGVRELRAYKARPLSGVWATPPFLHNGSVPSLYQLLSPQDERSVTFYRGNLEYDPAHLGYRSEAFPGGFLYDTRLTGNANSGHEFRDGPLGAGVIGRLLQPEERWALLEYLKVLGGPLEKRLP